MSSSLENSLAIDGGTGEGVKFKLDCYGSTGRPQLPYQNFFKIQDSVFSYNRSEILFGELQNRRYFKVYKKSKFFILNMEKVHKLYDGLEGYISNKLILHEDIEIVKQGYNTIFLKDGGDKKAVLAVENEKGER